MIFHFFAHQNVYALICRFTSLQCLGLRNSNNSLMLRLVHNVLAKPFDSIILYRTGLGFRQIFSLSLSFSLSLISNAYCLLVIIGRVMHYTPLGAKRWLGCCWESLNVGYERNGFAVAVGVGVEVAAALVLLQGSSRIWLIEGRGGGVTGANGFAEYGTGAANIRNYQRAFVTSLLLYIRYIRYMRQYYVAYKLLQRHMIFLVQPFFPFILRRTGIEIIKITRFQKQFYNYALHFG
jgi:hypothetical protein